MPLPQRGPLAGLARATQCGACGRPVREPVLLACEHGCCRRCLAEATGATAEEATTAATACPRCRRPSARRRTAVALAVESRLAQRLAALPAPPARPRPRPRTSLAARLRADAVAVPDPLPTPEEEEQEVAEAEAPAGAPSPSPSPSR